MMSRWTRLSGALITLSLTLVAGGCVEPETEAPKSTPTASPTVVASATPATPTPDTQTDTPTRTPLPTGTPTDTPTPTATLNVPPYEVTYESFAVLSGDNPHLYVDAERLRLRFWEGSDPPISDDASPLEIATLKEMIDRADFWNLEAGYPQACGPDGVSFSIRLKVGPAAYATSWDSTCSSQVPQELKELTYYLALLIEVHF